MIVEFVVGVLSNVFVWFVESIPAPAPPEWFDSAGAALTFVGQWVGYLNPWVPLPVLGVALLAVAAAWAVGNGVRIASKLLSLFTFGGGM